MRVLSAQRIRLLRVARKTPLFAGQELEKNVTSNAKVRPGFRCPGLRPSENPRRSFPGSSSRDLSVRSIRAAVSIAYSTTGIWLLYNLKKIISTLLFPARSVPSRLPAFSFDISRALCNQVAQSKCCLSSLPLSPRSDHKGNRTLCTPCAQILA